MATGVDGNAGWCAGGLGVGRPEPHAFERHSVEFGRRRAAMLPTTLPTHLPPADVVGEDVNDVRLLAEAPLEVSQLPIDLAILCRPPLLVSFPGVDIGRIELLTRGGRNELQNARRRDAGASGAGS
jgi:hypothetical protein